MLSYLGIIFIATFLAKLNKNNFFYIKLSLLFLAIVAGLRWEYGNDYVSYYSIYNTINENSVPDVEIGYRILNKIFYNLGVHFNIMLFFIESFNLFLFYKFIRFFSKKNEYYYIYIFLYLISNIYFFTLSGIRQGIAMHIFFYSMIYIYKKELLKFILISSIALFFHKSILIFIIFEIFTYKIKNKRKINIYMSLFLIILIFFRRYIKIYLTVLLNLLFLEKYSKYINFNNSHSGTGLVVLTKIVFIFILLYISKQKAIKNDNKKEYYIYNIIQYYILSLFTLVGINLFYRLAPYLSIFLIFMPDILILKNKKIKKILIVILGGSIYILIYIKTIENLDIKYRKYNIKYQIIINNKDVYKNKKFLYDQNNAEINIIN